MGKEEFVKEYADRLIEKDADIRGHFEKADDDRKVSLRKNLEYSLAKSYDTYAKEYFESKGLGSYVSTFLRTTGAGADAIGTYMFWALGGAGFGLKGVGLLEKTVADTIDEAHYLKHAKSDSPGEKLSDQTKIIGEGLAERAAAYLPLGIGEISDLLRGKSKYDSKITARALAHAKESFYDYIKRPEEGIKIARLDNFKNPAYDLESNLSLAA